MEFASPSVPHRVFAFWFGPPMNETRLRALSSLDATGAPVVLITEANLRDWILSGTSIHPSFPFLSEIHRADYLRAYFMHHHGGGYSDIKPTSKSWDDAFAALADSQLLAIGYPEIGKHGVARMGVDPGSGRIQPFNWAWWKYLRLRLDHHSLIGNGAYIVRPGTPMTTQWLTAVERKLDELSSALANHPSTRPKERGGHIYDGAVSEYPVFWSALHGDIFHPLVHQYRRRVLRILPPPSFVDYQ